MQNVVPLRAPRQKPKANMHRILIPGCALFALASFPTSASAWNAIGHMAVAKLAFDQIDSSDQLRLFKLLKTHPHYEKFLAASRPSDVNEAEWAIMRSSWW